MPRRSIVIALLVFAMLAVAPSPPLQAAPKAELWQRWTAHDAAATDSIDHSPWNAFLARYLVTGSDGVNRVDYGKAMAEGRAALTDYIEQLSTTAISDYARPEQMAYWINLYNALTVQVILDHYPVKSIRDIDTSPGLFSDGPWGQKLVTVEGERVALDDIEHQILRPIWQDPRIHYAVNCASIGCPNLQPAAFAAGMLDRQLDNAAIEFINDPRGVEVSDGRIVTSSIYSWFEEDFGGDDAGVIAHLKAYAEPDLAMRLENLNWIADHRYDWRLNDTTPSSGS